MNIGEVLISRLDKAILEAKTPLSRKYNHASETGWANLCLRRLCLLRECPEKQGEHSVDLLRKFEEGHRQERLVVEELRRAEGIEVIDAGEDKEVLIIPKFELVTELDAKIKVDGGPEIVTEIKSCDPGFFRFVQRNTSGTDLLKSPSFYLRMYPTQLWTQLIARKESFGLWLFKNRSDGKKHVIETDLSKEGMDVMGRTLDKIEMVNKLVAEGKAPDPSPCDGCSHCSFQDFCFEGKEFGPDIGKRQVEVIRNEDLEAKVSRWRELQAKLGMAIWKDIKENEKIEKELKDLFKGKDVLIGGVSIRVKSKYPMKAYNIPDDVKEKYLTYNDIYRMVIEDLEEKL